MKKVYEEVLDLLAEAGIEAHRQQVRKRAVIILASALLLAIGGLALLTIDLVAIGITVNDFQALTVRVIGFLLHVAGFLRLALFVLGDERELLFPRKKVAVVSKHR